MNRAQAIQGENVQKVQQIGHGSDNGCTVDLPNRTQTQRVCRSAHFFWAKVDKTPTCWLWTGSKTRGYGQFAKGYAHRFAWTLAHGAIPAGLQVCHRCDVPACVRVDHLFLGTAGDNIRDAASKDRLTVTRRRKLSLTDRLAIYHAPRDRATGAALARRYGVSKVVICLTRRGRFIGSGVWHGTKRQAQAQLFRVACLFLSLAAFHQQPLQAFSSPVEQGDRSLNGCARAVQFPVFSFGKVRGCHMNRSVTTYEVATEGNSLDSSCRQDIRRAVGCWRQTVTSSGLSDKEIAIDAGLTPQYYSKIASGAQGDLLGLVYRVGVAHPELRRDFVTRLAEAEAVDPMISAARDTLEACYRLMCMVGAKVPTRRLV